MKIRMKDLDDKRGVYLKYMDEKIMEEDWHGVMDIAADLRELEVEYNMIKELYDNSKTSK